MTNPEGPPPPNPWRVHAFAEVTSTSDIVRRLAEAGEPDGLCVVAVRQTAGRGTAGRNWASPPGNLHMSVLLRTSEPVRNLPQWSLLSALAVHDALSAHVEGAPGLALKWPNDILLDGAKIAGILVEADTAADAALRWMCVGIGANLAHAPVLPDRPTACLPHPAPPARSVADAVLAALAAWRRTRLTEGFGAIRRAWLARGPRHGAPLAVTAPHGSLAGLYEGLADDGALLLRSGGRVHAIHAGEVRA